MSFSKKVRQQVYDKYDGHCAYCGCALKMSEMQVEHVQSKFLSKIHSQEVDNSLDNLMPSCRQCNFYKNVSGLEGFRRKLNTILRFSCKRDFVVRLAIKYGFLKESDWDGRFYFEKISEGGSDCGTE